MLLFHILEKKYAFKGQKWNYKIDVNKQSCSPLQYALTGKRYGMNLSSTGLLTWTPSEAKVYKFTVSVRDPCGLNAFKQFTVDVKNCFCKEEIDGKCIWKNPVHPEDGSICKCPEGCRGKRFDWNICLLFFSLLL